jgi:acyl carrier protein
MEIPQVRKEYLRIETPPNAQNTNEKILIHLPSDPYLAENISNSPDGCYTVGDILLEDPPNSGEYLILGRQDDTLVHITGEKTNPIPMEDIIRRSPFVQQVAVIGHNQFCTAALIQLNIQQTSNLNSNQIEDIIWNSVEQANKDAPSHSRLVKQLVHILPINSILPITDKGNLMRQRVNQQYSTLITQIYDQFFNQQYQQKQIKWTKESIRKYLQDQLKSIVENINDNSRSIFDYGFNSLQVVQLRNLICENICQIPKNFLYENSSIDQMTEQLIQSNSISNEDPFHHQLTEQIIDKYIHLIKQNPIQSIKQNIKSERIFLVTGANGSLGSFIIRDLLKQSIVKRVYCLLRGEDTKQRLRESFQQRKLDINSLLDQRLVILSESMNLSDEYLGQNNEIYQELQNEVTDIIHSAWKMNFNQTIKDFEYDSILGVFNLLKLSASNNIQFHFISSISSAASGLLSQIKEEPLPRNPEIALPQGYGQSKYASEHLCWTARSLWSIFI